MKCSCGSPGTHRVPARDRINDPRRLCDVCAARMADRLEAEKPYRVVLA